MIAVTLSSEHAGRSMIAGPFADTDAAEEWAAGWTAAASAADPGLEAAQRDGAIPPGDWAATVTDEEESR